jgi:hypothetical protein
MKVEEKSITPKSQKSPTIKLCKCINSSSKPGYVTTRNIPNTDATNAKHSIARKKSIAHNQSKSCAGNALH